MITDISNYRNIGYPNTQNIWVRVDSDVDNACYGLGPFVTLTVEKLPFANPVSFIKTMTQPRWIFNLTHKFRTLLGTIKPFRLL
jgi:hypothetical protein